MKKQATRFIAFEGPDKVGKETQSRMAQEVLRCRGVRAVRVEVPYAKSIVTHTVIYWMLRSGWARRLPNVFQIVQFLNKLSFQLFYLPRLCSENDIVIFDRWGLSATIYGAATGVNPWLDTFMQSFVKRPHLTLVFAERSFRRKNAQDDSYEQDNQLQTKVRDLYKRWALDHSEDHVLVDNSRSLFEIHNEVMDRIGTPCLACGARLGDSCDPSFHR